MEESSRTTSVEDRVGVRRSSHSLGWILSAALLAVGLGLAVAGGGACQNAVSNAPMPDMPHGARLFTAHCVACHGPRGEGNGPAAIALQVRPRDFRAEPFRYVSSMNGVPTRDDLMQTIRHGRRFGEMPANPQLTDAEVESLADYVRELSRLSWVVRLTEEFGDDEDTEPEEIEEIAEERVTPEDQAIHPRLDPGFRPDTQVGRELYEASCRACHGPTGRGDALDKPRDDRGKTIEVRDLTSGEFRGGTTLSEVFKRIRCGVPGTPMPAQDGLSDEQVWQLVYYVRYLAGRR